MTDTVTRLLEMVDDYARERMHNPNKLLLGNVRIKRQALQDELVRLFTPLRDEQIRNMYHELCNSVGASYQTIARATEQAHGITGDSKRCPLCNYQHGHQIGCKNNPVDIALQHGIGEAK